MDQGGGHGQKSSKERHTYIVNLVGDVCEG